MGNRSPQRISLSLSQEAYSVILFDMNIFENAHNLDGFINNVIKNYRESSQASISLAKDRELDKYLEWLKRDAGKNELSSDETACINQLASSYAEDLKQKMISFPNGIPLKPRINNENYDVLCMGTPEFQEEKYYKREGKYIKALLEDYASLPFYKREEIYFKDKIYEINNAISSSKVIKLPYTNRNHIQKTIIVRPYRIVSGPLLEYHYLIALPMDHDWETPLLLRISRMGPIRTLKQHSHIEEEQESIERIIKEKGIQYITTKNKTTTKIILTSDGYKRYNTIIYLRPKAELKEIPNSNKWEATLTCAEAQIKDYFFQFGKEAEIVSPPELREWFSAKYHVASEVYDK